MTILDDYFGMLKGVIGNVPYRTIITKEMLVRILSFSDLLLKQGNESIIKSYILLLKEFMKVVKFLSTQDIEIKQDEGEILDIYCDTVFGDASHSVIFYNCIKILYENNLVVDLSEENQKRIIDYLKNNFTDISDEMFKDEIKKNIFTLLLLCVIDIFSIKVTLQDMSIFTGYKSSPEMIKILLYAFIPLNSREDLFEIEFKVDSFPINTSNESDSDPQLKLNIFKAIKEHFIQLVLNYKNGNCSLKKVNEAEEMIKCVISSLSRISHQTEFFQLFFSQSSEICSDIFIEMFTLRETIEKNEHNRIVNSERENPLLGDITNISQQLLDVHSNSFIYRFLNDLIMKNQEYYTVSIVEIVKTTMNVLCFKNDNVNNIYLSNLSQLLIIVYNMIILTENTKKSFFDHVFKGSFINFCSEIRKTHLLYSRIRINECNKMISEMLFDILIEAYDLTKHDEYLLLFGETFLYNTNGNAMSKTYKRYYDAFTSEGNPIPKDVKTIFFILDAQNLKEYTSLPINTERITQIENMMSMNISDEAKEKYKKIKVNYTLFFMIKILLYLQGKKENSNGVLLLSKILYEDILYLKKKHSRSHPAIYSNSTKERMYNDMQKAVDDVIKNKRGFEGLREWFSKTYEIAKDYKNYWSYNLFFTGRTLSGGSGSEFSQQTKSDSSTSLSLVGARTMSSPREIYPRAMTDNFSESSEEFKLNINETDSVKVFTRNNTKKATVKEEKPKKRGFFDFFRRSKKKEEKEEEAVNSITNSDAKKRKNTSLTQQYQNEEKSMKCFDEIHSNNLILCPKKEILLTRFGIYFRQVYFSCEMFKKMKQKYKLEYLRNVNYDAKQLDYPTKLRNFSNSESPPMFLKLNQNFYTSEYFPISHSYAVPILNKKFIKHIPFVQRSLDVPRTTYFNCELINVESSIYGGVKITDEFILFEDSPNDPRKTDDYDAKLQYIFSSVSTDTVIKRKQFIAFYSEIKEMLYRRFLYIWQAVEIFLKDGKSYYLNFFSKEKFEQFIACVTPYMNQSQIINEQKSLEKVKEFENQWVNYQITNYEYLLKLNKYSTRTYKETNQYPVFPWVIRRYDDIINPLVIFSKKEYEEYKEECIRKNIIPTRRLTVYRDMKYPISLQNEEKRESAIKKFNDNLSENLFPCHLGNHYSTSSYVYYYLMRIVPFMNALIKLQNKTQENPNRMFDSLLNTQIVLDSSTDSRELIPEFYTSIEFMLNLNCAYFGEKSNKKIVDDIINRSDKPNVSSKDDNPTTIHYYPRILYYNRKIINNDYISNDIIYWINYIFGNNQLSNKAEACNVFSEESYAQRVNLKKDLETMLKGNNVDKKDIYRQITDKINLIINFGQSPLQIFNHNHPKKAEQITTSLEADDIDYLSFSINEGGSKKIVENKMIYFNSFKKSKTFYGLEVRNDKVKYMKIFTIDSDNKETTGYFKVRFSMGEKVRNNSKNIKDNRKFYLDSLDYAFKVVECQKTYYISCRYLDNSFKVHTLKNHDIVSQDYTIYAEDYVNAIEVESEKFLLIGLRNGKLIEYEIEMRNDAPFFTEKRYVLAHEGRIRVIEYNKRLNVIITAGDDNMIYIRKAYNFELLTVIRVDKRYKVITCKLSELNFLYVFCCNYASREQKNVIIGYTINGIEFARSEEKYYTNFDILQNGNIVTALSEIDSSCVNVYELVGYSLKEKEEPELRLEYNGKVITTRVQHLLVKDSYLCMISKQKMFNWSNIEKKAYE